MNKEIVSDLLKALCQYYTESYGGSVTNLKSWVFDHVEFETNPSIRVALDQYSANSDRENLAKDTLEYLLTRGYLLEESSGFSLSEAGLYAGTKSGHIQLLAFSNRNPGLSVALTLAAYLVSIFVLYTTYK